ncbi:hypothetical protein BU25DRAFT_75408 [Macroventuria anomochaeta]|uniref:Uncharacterized protein n=1 Tax=Macroventuria anomochaeta TaxID=301207 RepID=A0ACB6S162_9PLEO|nr:uncharacterized protein BU25DRAFT_75408 [Macroventuria anomochaeta]KAF2626934.1 hypothetical protein BU25DRAFT_75408 [Macroventuria anomochaeta]
MSPNLLHARQEPQPLATTLIQPTTTLALSTTFTPPASCALPSQINILPPPGYLIWWNEPVPYTSMTISSCYPPEFLTSYTSIAPTTARALGSSIVPAMSPLVCPENFCTQYVGDNNYIACCPSGYKFATTGTPVMSNRPAYGGICYTDIPISQELTAVMYDSTGSAHQEVWAPSTTGAQGWAHPIDGWAASSAVVGCTVKRATSSGGTSSSSVATSDAVSTIVSSTKEKARKAPGGVIAGAVLGALVALAAILALVLFLLRRRKRAKQDVGGGEQMSQSDDGTPHQVEGAQIHQKDGDTARVEVHAVPSMAELDSSRGGGTHEMGTGPERVSELPAGNDGRVDKKHAL